MDFFVIFLVCCIHVFRTLINSALCEEDMAWEKTNVLLLLTKILCRYFQHVLIHSLPTHWVAMYITYSVHPFD